MPDMKNIPTDELVEELFSRDERKGGKQMNEHIKPKPNRCKLAEAVQVIRTVTLVGSGTQENPCRDVVQYWTLDGQLIATIDPNNSLKEEPEITRISYVDFNL